MSMKKHTVHLYSLYKCTVCVFIDIIGQTRHYQCPVYKCTMCALVMPRLSYLCQWRNTHSTIVYRTLVMPRLSYYVNEETHSTFVFMILVIRTDGALPMSCIQLYYVCVFIDINRTEEALPMSCIQMYYVCVFTDIIGQTRHYQCPAYKCTMCVSSLTY
jgi:hypothetical protein